VDAEPDAEYASIERLEALLVPHSSPATISLEKSNGPPVVASLDEDGI